MCTSTPRHCAHNKALLGMDDGQGEFPPRTRSPKDVAEESISSMLDKDTKKMKPPCMSKHKLPFFPHEDAEVEMHCKGRPRALFIMHHCFAFRVMLFFLFLCLPYVPSCEGMELLFVVAAFKGGSFVLPDLVLPEHTCCEDVAQMVKTEHEMTVYSSNAVMTTMYVIMHCLICDVSNRADGKKVRCYR